MKGTDILRMVQEGADARFGDTIEQMLLLLRRQHTHQSHKKECFCEYCKFIRKEYTDSKLALHRVKRRFGYYDQIWNLTNYENELMVNVQSQMVSRMNIVRDMKKKKFDMWKDVL